MHGIDDSPARIEIVNGGSSIAQRLLRHNFDSDWLRPYIGSDGRTYITQNGKGGPEAVVTNTVQGTLLKEEWQLIDRTVQDVQKPRLRLVNDLRSSNLEVIVPNAMAKTVLQHQMRSDMTPAKISMDGMARSEGDRPIYDLVNIPIPLLHKDFSFPARQMHISRGGGNAGSEPLDMGPVALATERVAELAEQLVVGTQSYQYGGGTIYGMRNFPYRIAFTMTKPTAGGYSPVTTLNEVLQMKLLSQQANCFGPWRLYFSLAWEPYLDNDYKALGNMTLRQRLRTIDNIASVDTADYLNSSASGFSAVLVQQSRRTIEVVIGMEIQVLQWTSLDGMEFFFKVIGIIFPRMRADHNGNTGVVDGEAP